MHTEPTVSTGQDETDAGPTSIDSTSSHTLEGDPASNQPSISTEALDFLVTESGNVMGIKGRVKMQAEQPEMGSITESLKQQAAAQGRYLSIKRKKQQKQVSEGVKANVAESLEKTQPLHLVVEEEPSTAAEEEPSTAAEGRKQTDRDAKERTETKTRKTSSLRRRPRGPAPPPPKPYAAGTMPKVAADEAVMRPRAVTTSSSATAPKPRESSTLPRVRMTPVRKAPTRPAPVPQKKPDKAEPSKADPSVAELNKAEPRAVGASFNPPEPKPAEESAEQVVGMKPTDFVTEPKKPVHTSTPTLAPKSPASEPEKPVHTSTPTLAPKNPTSGSSPPTPKHNSAIAICREKEDGGKVLIVTPSPASQRKHAYPVQLVFNLPPPPPLETKEKERVEATSKRKTEESSPLESKPSDEGIVTDTGSSPLEPAANRSEMSPGQESILSNEYTNMDDLCSSTEELETDFSNEANLDPIPETEVAAVAASKDRDELDSSNSSSSEEGGFHIPSGNDSDSVCGYDVAEASPLHQADLALPPPIPASPIIALKADVNSNNNNNNNSSIAAAPGMELDSIPPPPAQFVMPPEPLFDHNTSNGDDSDEGGGGIVLVSVKRSDLDAPVYPEELQRTAANTKAFGEESHREEGVESPAVSNLKESKSINTSLNELDTMVTSLQQLISDTTGTPPPTPPPPRPPPPPITAVPPPPRSPTGTLEAPGSPRTRAAIPSKPYPPPSPTTPTKQLPDGGAVHSELASKLKERQKRLKAQAQADPGLPPPIPPPPQIPLPPAEITGESIPLLKAPRSHSGTASPHSGTLTPRSGTASPQAVPSGDNVQAQLQFLQQQVLHQQMMQLQQQFQQLQQMTINQNVQHMMMPHGQPFLQQATAMANPALLGMQPQPAMVSMPTVIPMQPQQPLIVAASTPQGVPVSVYAAPVSQPSLVHPGVPTATQLPQNSVVPHTLVHQQSAPSLLLSSQAAATTLPAPSNPVDPVVLREVPAAVLKRRKSTSDFRSQVLGELENTFDSLMEEVRDADPKEVLRKVSLKGILTTDTMQL